MKITIELDDHDTNEKHVAKFLKLLERIIVILEDEPKEDDDE
tara:strand:+ start:1172 stop:1297 length:126 start_codon:yes stop_codon:yes gene_type:complete